MSWPEVEAPPHPPAGAIPSIETLGPEDRRTLAYASAIGRDFDFHLLAAALGAEQEDLAEQLESLAHAGILKEHQGGDRFVFIHDELRVQIYQDLTASRLRVLHRKIAEAMEKMYPGPPEEALAELGRHFFLGKVPEKSFRYNHEAAGLALSAENPEAALHHLERARIDLTALPSPPPEAAAELALELGNLYFSAGELRAAEEVYREGLARLSDKDLKLRGRLLLARADVVLEEAEISVADETIREAHDLFNQTGDLQGIAAVHRIRGRVALRRGAFREALEETMMALQLLQDDPDASLSGRLYLDVAATFASLGPAPREEARVWLQRGVDKLSTIADWSDIARGYTRMADIVAERSPKEALDHLAKARDYAGRVRELRWTARAWLKEVPIRLAIGDIPAAEHDNQQADRLLERIDDPYGQVLLRMNRAFLAEERRKPSLAEEEYRQAIECADRSGFHGESAECHVRLAQLLQSRGETLSAREHLREAEKAGVDSLRPTWAQRLQTLSRETELPPPTPTTAG
jgi:tetratricopeptide (TPR) repeat protein